MIVLNNAAKNIHHLLLLLVVTTGLFFSPVQYAVAKLPDDLPGTEITEDQYFNFLIPQDSIEQKMPPGSPESNTWLDRAAKTWEAPPISVQLGEDKQKLLLGMGAIFIPYMSDPNNEPHIEIYNNIGKVMASGKPGQKYNLLPDRYHVILGSGSHKQKIVRTIHITENEIIPLLPDWSGLSIDVVNDKNQPFRGEYEIARIDTFEVFGRGTGRNPDLGEDIKTWILKPGLYKLYGVGESYNTLKNFVTVRLLPGEFVRFVLVEKGENDMTIIGGGIVQFTAGSEITSKWKYGFDIGGAIDFNYAKERNDDKDTVTVNENDISVQFDLLLNYEQNPIEWETQFNLDEGVTFHDFSEFDFTKLSSTIDEFRIKSIFTWHLLNWMGPYCRAEFITGIIPERVRKQKGDISFHYILLDKNLHLDKIDSTKEYYKTQPIFSPILFESGIGTNMNILNTRYFDAQILTGIGYTYERHWNEFRIGKDSDIDSTIMDSTDFQQCKNILANEKYVILIDKHEDRHDIGPEILLNNSLYLGRYISIESELKFFAPFKRITRPDLQWRSAISWRVARMVTLDYEYKYKLIQEEQDDLEQDESRHRVLIRFSFSGK